MSFLHALTRQGVNGGTSLAVTPDQWFNMTQHHSSFKSQRPVIIVGEENDYALLQSRSVLPRRCQERDDCQHKLSRWNTEYCDAQFR